MYSRFSAAVRFSEPPLGTRFRALGGQPCAPTPQSWLRIPGVDRQPGRLRPRRRLHTSEPRRESADARYHAAWKARMVERFEWHYTPKHGSWLNLAESELGVLTSQCLDRRIPNKQ